MPNFKTYNIMDVEYLDILTEKIFRQFRLVALTTFFAHFVYPVGVQRMGWIGIIVILASWEVSPYKSRRKSVAISM